ncbi:MAG: S8 family serine peptidase, partial [Caldilineaceae bacterium]|nr:S8 family serine peptidase [Caldilineaceae bacterium]
YAEPNYLLHIARTPDDPDFDKLWGLRNVGQTGGTNGADVSAMAAWDIATGSRDIVVAIIDTGIDFNHPDLADNMWVNKKECPQGYGKCSADGKDDDNNGYVDDFYGANTINDTGEIMDDFGHGTHVAGTIGGVGNNGVGVVGVNWNVQLLGCKFLSASGSGSTANAIKCFNYVTELKEKQGYNILVTNNSWGGGLASDALRDAMGGDDAPLHICAAGNANSSRISYPAGYELDNIISVAATDHEDLYASFSNWGADWVDLAAPGVDIYSTVPSGSCVMCDSSGYRTASGTSMATPHVAGAAALVLSTHTDLTNEQVKNRFLSGVDALTDRSKGTLTNGRLNLLNALEEDSVPPAPVTNLAVSSVLMTQIDLSWTATGDDGLQGTANAYDVRYATAPISTATWDEATPVDGEPAPQPAGAIERMTVTGLQPATTYYFAMKVMDNVGNESDLSNIVVVATSAGTIVFADDMESGSSNWETVGDDNLWHLSQLRANSPTTAWYYGKEDTRNYDTGTANRGYLASRGISLVDADEVMLTFYEWSELQANEEFDRTRVQVSTDGDAWQTVFESHGTEEGWAKRTVSLTPYIERSGTIQIRFWFDTVNDRFNTYEGWFVDDVQVLVAKATRPGEERPMANLVMRPENIGFGGFTNPANAQGNPIDGDKVVIHAVVLNDGRSEANDVRVLFNHVPNGTEGSNPTPIGQPQTIATIPAGGSGVAEVVFDTTDAIGTHAIQVTVDPSNFIPEVSTTDNVAVRMLTVAPRPSPNLVIESTNIGFDPSAPDPGDQVTVRATIRNDGDAEAADVQVQFVDATGTGTVPIGPLQTIDVIPAGDYVTLQITYDTSGLSGNRDVGVVVDPNNTINESKESDNSAEKRLALTEPAAPNLVMLKTNIGFAPVNPTEGDMVTIRTTVLNDGNAEATDVLVQFVDGTQNASTPIGEQQTIAAIPAGGSGIAEVTYDTSDKAGDRKINIVVDPHNFVAESKESDNRSEETLTVALPPTPNLVVQAGNIGFSPVTPVDGDEVIVYATIVNNGDADADDVQVQFVDVTDGGALTIGERQTINSIAAGGSSTVQVSYATAGHAGERTLQVVVDPSNLIAETDETDNLVKKTLRIERAAMPNLVMLASNVEFNPPEPLDHERVTIHAVVLNQGAIDAHNVLVQFIDMTTGVATPIAREQYIEHIAVGGSAHVEATLALNGQARDRKIQVLVDSNNLIEESNERDNTATKSLAVTAAPAPNLVVVADNIGFGARTLRVGDAVTVSAVILNNGTATAEGVVVQFTDVTNGRPLPIGEQQVIDSIPAGGSGVATILFDSSALLDLLPGSGSSALYTRQIRVTVDPNNFIEELDEIDNKDTALLALAPPPLANLVVQSNNIGFDPPIPAEGDGVSVTVTILNAGVIDANDVLVQFVDVTDGSLTPIGAKQTLPRIDAGTSATAQVTYATTGKEGARKIQVLVDPHTVIPESNEGDNSAIQTLTVMPAPAPNLVVQAANVGFSPSTPTEGETVNVRATVLNTGNAEASDVQVQFIDATSNGTTPIDSNQVIESIPPGGSAVAEITYSTTGKVGDRKIQVIADRNNLIIEQNESDNSATATLEVAALPAPNLYVQMSNIGFDPVQANPGDQVTVYATILNIGTADATDVLVQFVDATNSSSPLPIGQPQTIEAIVAGGSGTVQIVYDSTGLSGDRKIQVVADPNNFIPETKETDNNSTKTLSLVPESAPNLVLSSNNLIFVPNEPTEGAFVTIRALVINDGNAPANNVAVQFLDITESSSGVAIGQPQVIDVIEVGGSGVAEVRYNTAGTIDPNADEDERGERKIKVVVDPNNFITESKETDNTVSSKTLTVATAAGPNLVMLAGNIGFNPAQPIDGDRVSIHAVVINNGRHDANDVAVQFVDVSGGSHIPIGPPQVIDSIPAGGSGTAQVLYDSSGQLGERRIEVNVDPNNFIPETNESDNAAIGLVTVAAPPAPNLMVLAGNVKFKPSEPTQGQPVSVTVTILNGGTADASDVVLQVLDVTNGG